MVFDCCQSLSLFVPCPCHLIIQIFVFFVWTLFFTSTFKLWIQLKLDTTSLLIHRNPFGSITEKLWKKVLSRVCNLIFSRPFCEKATPFMKWKLFMNKRCWKSSENEKILRKIMSCKLSLLFLLSSEKKTNAWCAFLHTFIYICLLSWWELS